MGVLFFLKCLFSINSVFSAWLVWCSLITSSWGGEIMELIIFIIVTYSFNLKLLLFLLIDMR